MELIFLMTADTTSTQQSQPLPLFMESLCKLVTKVREIVTNLSCMLYLVCIGKWIFFFPAPAKLYSRTLHYLSHEGNSRVLDSCWHQKKNSPQGARMSSLNWNQSFRMSQTLASRPRPFFPSTLGNVLFICARHWSRKQAIDMRPATGIWLWLPATRFSWKSTPGSSFFTVVMVTIHSLRGIAIPFHESYIFHDTGFIKPTLLYGLSLQSASKRSRFYLSLIMFSTLKVKDE